MTKFLLIAAVALIPTTSFADPVMDLKFPEPVRAERADLDYKSTGSIVKPIKTEKADAKKVEAAK